MKKIRLTTCYFGSFPWYFDFFIKSCLFNPTIDFLIFSDAIYKHKLPDNVSMVPYQLSDFNILASKRLGHPINIKNPYKLCDFKPAFGFIFSDYLKEYDFWGICDIDIILGRIREFFPQDLLEQFDIFSVNKYYPSGFFMLFRNTTKSNQLFMQSKDFKRVFTSDTHYCFDECNFKHDFLVHGGNIFDIYSEIESMHHVLLKQTDGNIKVCFRTMAVESLPGELKWENGIFSFLSEYEILLYHLIDYKSNILTKKWSKGNVPNEFYISSYSIYKKHKAVSFARLCFLFDEKFKPSFYKGLNLLNFSISNFLKRTKYMNLLMLFIKFESSIFAFQYILYTSMVLLIICMLI